MRKNPLDLSRLTPPGMSPRRELVVYLVALAVAVIINLIFPLICKSEVHDLYEYGYIYLHYGILEQPLGTIPPGTTMPSFAAVLGPLPLAYLAVALLALTYAARHRAALTLESNALYLLRRLPTRGETFRRVLLLPLLLVALTLAVAMVHTAVNYGIYIRMTPPQCRPTLL